MSDIVHRAIKRMEHQYTAVESIQAWSRPHLGCTMMTSIMTYCSDVSQYEPKSFRDVCAAVSQMVLGHASHTQALWYVVLLERSY